MQFYLLVDKDEYTNLPLGASYGPIDDDHPAPEGSEILNENQLNRQLAQIDAENEKRIQKQIEEDDAEKENPGQAKRADVG